MLLLLSHGVCGARVMLQSPPQGDVMAPPQKKTSSVDALPLLVLLIIPGFCLAQMQFDHWVARRKRAREAKHAQAEDAYTAGRTPGTVAAAAAESPPAAAATSEMTGVASSASANIKVAEQTADCNAIAPPPA